MRSTMRRLATTFASLALAASIGAVAEAATGQVVIEQKSLRLPSGETLDYEIGTLYAPENRDDPASRKIGVGFARIKALHPTSAPPVFWLPGGPGLSVLGALTGDDEAARSRLRAWLNFRDAGDLVVVEQRGYTSRGEKLEELSDAQPLDQPASIGADTLAMRTLARRAVAHHPKADLSGYTVAAFAADVDDVRQALGYDRISLFGGSFGSQWSLAVMRLYPERVARAVLSSVEPLNDGFDRPSHVFASLQRIAYDADRDPGLAPYLPTGGMMAAIDALTRRFAAGPVRVGVDDGGRPVTVVLGAGDLQQALLSHTQEMERWPAFILSLYHGRYDDWARETLETRRAAPVTLIGPLVDSSLATTAENAHLLRTDPALALLGAWNFEANFATAPDWPTPDIGDAIRRPRVNPTPVVFVHGDWDTSTPIENTLGLLPYFPNGHAILVHRAGHDGAFYQLRENPAAKQAIYDFLRTGATAGLPTEVVLSTPKFETPAFPPPVARP